MTYSITFALDFLVVESLVQYHLKYLGPSFSCYLERDHENLEKNGYFNLVSGDPY
jgi:hypothetical protein